MVRIAFRLVKWPVSHVYSLDIDLLWPLLQHIASPPSPCEPRNSLNMILTTTVRYSQVSALSFVYLSLLRRRNRLGRVCDLFLEQAVIFAFLQMERDP